MDVVTIRMRWMGLLLGLAILQGGFAGAALSQTTIERSRDIEREITVRGVALPTPAAAAGIAATPGNTPRSTPRSTVSVSFMDPLVTNPPEDHCIDACGCAYEQ